MRRRIQYKEVQHFRQSWLWYLLISSATISVLLVLVVPLSLASVYAFREVSHLFTWMLATNRYGAAVPVWMPAIPMVGEKLASYWNAYLGQPHALGDLVQLVSGEHIGNIYRMVLGFAGNAARLILALFFMLLIAGTAHVIAVHVY